MTAWLNYFRPFSSGGALRATYSLHNLSESLISVTQFYYFWHDALDTQSVQKVIARVLSIAYEGKRRKHRYLPELVMYKVDKYM